MKTKVLLLVTILSCLFANSQTRSCASTEKMNEMMFNPLMKAKYLEQVQKSEEELLRLANNPQERNPQATLRIPVAVHFPLESNANRACLVALAQNQIDILNNDYNGTNADISIWNNTTSSYFPGVNNGSIDIELVLATQNHPAGTDPNLVNGQPAVTIGYNFAANGDWNSTWAGYLNIVVDDADGNLGYAYLASSPATGSAIFINYSAFASGSGCGGVVPAAPYNLGRTLTHELGHYLNLRHIWGDANCGNDFVADTPQHDEDNGGCPSINHFSNCTGSPRELTMNYMDYTNDVCMYMFTAGQATRQQAHLNTIASSFNQNTLSSDTFLSTPSFSVYPNPNNGSFSIDLDKNAIDNSVIVYDITGRKVYENNFQNATSIVNIQMNSTTKGVYSIVVSNGENTSSRKMIIQ